uniref:Putative ribonuclease H-like domain-containing protein n=1 Tax=Tanacetum cinerariifolium TaxID=118510 RepID=A0A6L2P0N7_TANCI|nr:putative ribonuclease H-like domain-containing protein [Tanacetum cinerariifolium]
MHKTILKQQYENFITLISEGLDKTYDRFQKLIIQLELNGEVISQEDANMKLLRSLPPAWNNIALIMRNKPGIETLSMDDLYNNLKVYEAEIKRKSSSGSNSHNVAFVSFENTSSINETVNVSHDIHAACSKEQPSASSYADDVMFSFFASQSNTLQLDNEDLESADNERRVVPVETPSSSLVVQDGLGVYDWSYQAKEGPTDFALMAHYSGSANSSNSKITKSRVYETFGSPVTILNTLDHLGKFDGKADEGFLVRYSVNSKAFRVFNSRTRKVEKNLHVKFLENKPNVAGNGPKWLFDIDSLKKSMNYEPVSVGNQSNGDACIQTDIHAGQASQEKAVIHEYNMLPFISSNPPLSLTIQSSDVNAGDQLGDVNACDIQSDVDEILRNDDVCQGNEVRIDSSTHAVNAASRSINTASNIIAAEADTNNLDSSIVVSPIPITRVHKDHPKEQVIGDPNLNTQIRRMINFSKETAMVSFINSWIEAIQEELLQFKLQDVWTLVDLPYGKRAIGSKWVFRNKLDERGIVIRNKARLIAQGHTHEKGIDYDEVFAPVAWIEAIRLFLAYASFKDFIVYQMDVKCAFLYGKIEEEVYVCQPPGFEDLDFQDNVYKVKKALYGLHQAPRAWYLTMWFIAILGYLASFRGLPVEIGNQSQDSYKPGRVFWGADEEISDGGSPRVIVYEYDGLSMLPVSPPSPDYIPGLKEPQTPPAPQDEDEHELMFIQPHDPDFVPEPIYPEYIQLEDEHILLAEEQQHPPVISPTTESPGYVVESDLEEGPEEYEKDEAEDGPVDYLKDGGDDGDDEDDGDSLGYDADNEDEDDGDEEEEEEQLAPADSVVIIPIDELGSPHEGTEPIISPPSTDTTTIRARITIRPQTSISLLPDAEVERLLAMPTPSPSPLTSLSPPSVGERLTRCMAPAALPLPPLPSSSYPPSPVERRDGIPESEQPPHKRLCLSTLGSRYEVGESSTRSRGVDYGFADTIEAEMRHREKVNTRVTEIAELHEHDTHDLYALLKDAQDGRTRISQWVNMDSQRVNLLMGDMMTLYETVWIVEEEAYAARDAWA